jgi:hypothetical protein
LIRASSDCRWTNKGHTISYSDANPEVLGIAGGSVASALLDLLVKRQIITAEDARTICRNAQTEIKRQIGMRRDAASALIDEFVRTLPQECGDGFAPSG